MHKIKDISQRDILERAGKFMGLFRSVLERFDSPTILSEGFFLDDRCSLHIHTTETKQVQIQNHGLEFNMGVEEREGEGITRGGFVSFRVFVLRPGQRAIQLFSIVYGWHEERGTYRSLNVGNEDSDEPKLKFDSVQEMQSAGAAIEIFSQQITDAIELTPA
jgi:hypothetical protein